MIQIKDRVRVTLHGEDKGEGTVVDTIGLSEPYIIVVLDSGLAEYLLYESEVEKIGVWKGYYSE